MLGSTACVANNRKLSLKGGAKMQERVADKKFLSAITGCGH